MDHFSIILFDILQTSGMFAPLAFILLHIMRQLFFIPVGFICMIGGVLFGALFGAVYSVIGITLTSICFYVLFKRVPKLFKKVFKLKEKCLGKRITFSFGQIIILRLIPFMHFHLISLFLMESTSNLKEYTKASFVANLPLAVVYTAFGNWISRLSVQWVIIVLTILLIAFYLLRKKEWAMTWDEFFQARSA